MVRFIFIEQAAENHLAKARGYENIFFKKKRYRHYSIIKNVADNPAGLIMLNITDS